MSWQPANLSLPHKKNPESTKLFIKHANIFFCTLPLLLRKKQLLQMRIFKKWRKKIIKSRINYYLCSEQMLNSVWWDEISRSTSQSVWKIFFMDACEEFFFFFFLSGIPYFWGCFKCKCTCPDDFFFGSRIWNIYKTLKVWKNFNLNIFIWEVKEITFIKL